MCENKKCILIRFNGICFMCESMHKASPNGSLLFLDGHCGLYVGDIDLSLYKFKFDSGCDKSKAYTLVPVGGANNE